jgi:hypothetical protein
MFRRSIEVNVVKTPKNQAVGTTSEEVTAVDYTEAVQETVRIIAANAILGMVAFVALDTARQVIVKLTPGH